MAVIQWWCERGAKSHVAKEISRGGRRRSRDEKGNRGVGDFRFINILQLFSIYFFFRLLLLYLFVFSILFLPTTFIHSHTHDPHPRPLPTTYDPRHLASNIPLALVVSCMHFCPVKIRRGFESSSVCVGMYNSGITNALARVPDGQDKKSLALLSVLFFGQPPLFKRIHYN